MYIPKTKPKYKNCPPWLTKTARNACNTKRRHFRDFLKSKSPADLAKYKKSEKACKKTILREKKKFERKVANSSDKRSFSYYVKSKSKCKEGIGPLKNNGTLTHDDQQMSKILNDYFASVFTKDTSGSVCNYPDRNNGHILSNIVITPNDVKETIINLKNSGSIDPNGFSNRFLKDFNHELKRPLCKIFNQSLQSGVVPADWKTANVVPIFKKGVKSEPGNYRPVSLTSVICKTMERILQKKLVDHLEKNDLLKNSQHGFRSKRSCATNLIEFLDYTTSKVDLGDPVDIIYYDFSKAFDKVSIPKLLHKLYAYGVRGNLHRWIKSWLTGRRQRTTINGQYSTWAEVLSGVPQGSVLGPLLFIVYIDDIYECAVDIDKITKFADDTKTANKSREPADRLKLQECIDNMYRWAQNWCMEFNIPKCKILHLGFNNPGHIYTMNGIPIDVVDHEKDIGIHITKSLKPSDHCAKAAGTGMGVLFQLLRSFHYRDRKVFVNLYKTYVRPHLEFSSPVWNPWLKKDIETIEKVQQKFVRNITSLKTGTYEEKLSELKLLKLEDRRFYLDMLEVFKLITNRTNLERKDLFEIISDNPRMGLRSSDCPRNIILRRVNLDIRKNFFTNRIADHWNKLPEDLKMAQSLSAFKLNLKSHLIAKYLDAPPAGETGR